MTETRMKCDDFEKPKLRPEHSRVENAVEIVTADQTSFKQTCDTAWILLCRLSQNVLPFPECSVIAGRSVPFWTGFNSLLAKEDQEGAYTAVAYQPVIDSQRNYDLINRSTQILSIWEWHKSCHSNDGARIPHWRACDAIYTGIPCMGLQQIPNFHVLGWISNCIRYPAGLYLIWQRWLALA